MRRRPTNRPIRQSLRSAFTLMEVMLVLVIIAAIAGLVISNLGGFQRKADEKIARTYINNLRNAVESYKMEMRSYPPDLNALYEKPANVNNAANWYRILTKPPAADPWGNAYEYSVVDAENFEIRSLGPDGTRSDDDILP
jgi:general secretion pathway protein G